MANYSHNANGLMPLMTANDTPSPIIITDSTSSSTSYRACGRNDQDTGWFSSGASGWWKVYTGGVDWVVTSYTITYNHQYGTYPSAWTFLGSNDNVNWDTLDTISGQSFSSFEMKTYSISNTQHYTYYKINVTGNNGGSWVGFSEIELIGTIYEAPPPPPPSSRVPSGDIVPRANGFGNLGTSIKKWLNGYFYNIFATGGTISGVNIISETGETISGPVTTSAGVGDANKLVALNDLGIIDSTMISGISGDNAYVGLTWNMATSSIPVLSNNGYFLNPTANITLTLPASPSVGDPINIVDIYNKASTYVITVARNGNNIEGVAEDLIINIDGAGISLVYADVTRGWELVSEIGRRGINSNTSITSGGDSFLVSQIFS